MFKKTLLVLTLLITLTLNASAQEIHRIFLPIVQGGNTLADSAPVPTPIPEPIIDPSPDEKVMVRHLDYTTPSFDWCELQKMKCNFTDTDPMFTYFAQEGANIIGVVWFVYDDAITGTYYGVINPKDQELCPGASDSYCVLAKVDEGGAAYAVSVYRKDGAEVGPIAVVDVWYEPNINGK